MPIAQLSGDYVSEDLSEAHDADRSLVVRFTMEARPDHEKSAEAGRAVYRDREYISILIPGDKTLSVFRPTIPSDKNRFPRQYAAFKNSQGEAVIGTPLIGWPQVTEAQRKELEYFNIRTVEALANVADGFASNMMGVQALKQAAQKFIAQSKDSAIVNKLNTELAQRDTLLATMQEQMASMAEKLAALEAGDKTPKDTRFKAKASA
jgi:uncharacterized coiled-coil protein SlyX